MDSNGAHRATFFRKEKKANIRAGEGERGGRPFPKETHQQLAEIRVKILILERGIKKWLALEEECGEARMTIRRQGEERAPA